MRREPSWGIDDLGLDMGLFESGIPGRPTHSLVSWGGKQGVWTTDAIFNLLRAAKGVFKKRADAMLPNP